MTDREAEKYSPLLRDLSADASVLIVVGGSETSLFRWQSDQAHEQWITCKGCLERFDEPDVDHFDVVNRLANQKSALFQKICDWVQ